MSIGQELLDVPMGDMIRDMAFAIADSQFQLDQSSMRASEMMGGLQSVFDSEGNQTFDDSRVFFGYEYMTVTQALAYAMFDDSLSGSLDADSIRLKKVVIDIIAELDGVTPDQVAGMRDAADGSSAASGLSQTVRDTVIRVPTRLSMMELGFTPTFYQFVDTIIEVKIAIRITREREFSRTTSNASRDTSSSGEKTKRGGVLQGLLGGRRSSGYRSDRKVQTTQVDATYSSKYSYSAEGASLLRTKLVPVPPPAILTERIRGFMEIEEEARRRRLQEIFPANDGGA
jgi:hypothetical protein